MGGPDSWRFSPSCTLTLYSVELRYSCKILLRIHDANVPVSQVWLFGSLLVLSLLLFTFPPLSITTTSLLTRLTSTYCSGPFWLSVPSSKTLPLQCLAFVGDGRFSFSAFSSSFFYTDYTQHMKIQALRWSLSPCQLNPLSYTPGILLTLLGIPTPILSQLKIMPCMSRMARGLCMTHRMELLLMLGFRSNRFLGMTGFTAGVRFR